MTEPVKLESSNEVPFESGDYPKKVLKQGLQENCQYVHELLMKGSQLYTWIDI